MGAPSLLLLRLQSLHALVQARRRGDSSEEAAAHVYDLFAVGRLGHDRLACLALGQVLSDEPRDASPVAELADVLFGCALAVLVRDRLQVVEHLVDVAASVLDVLLRALVGHGDGADDWPRRLHHLRRLARDACGGRLLRHASRHLVLVHLGVLLQVRQTRLVVHSLRAQLHVDVGEVALLVESGLLKAVLLLELRVLPGDADIRLASLRQERAELSVGRLLVLERRDLRLASRRRADVCNVARRHATSAGLAATHARHSLLLRDGAIRLPLRCELAGPLLLTRRDGAEAIRLRHLLLAELLLLAAVELRGATELHARSLRLVSSAALRGVDAVLILVLQVVAVRESRVGRICLVLVLEDAAGVSAPPEDVLYSAPEAHVRPSLPRGAAVLRCP